MWTGIGLAAGAIGGALITSQANKKIASQQQQFNQDPWAPANPYLQQLLGQVQQYQQSPFPYGSPADMVAPLTQQQMSAAGTVDQGVQGGTQLNSDAQNGIKPFLSGQFMNVENNPYLQAATNAAIRPITQNYQENVLPQISSNFSVGTDAYDQSREGIAKGIASRGYLDAVSNVSSQMANRGYETGVQATQNAIGQVPQLTQSATAPGQAQWNIGALLQAQNQRLADAPGAYDALQQQRLQFPLNAYTAIGSIGRGGTGTTSGGYSNPYLGAVGGALIGNQLQKSFWPQQAPQQQGVGIPGVAGSGAPPGLGTGMTQDNAGFLPW
jgi:hypothetical protein